MIRNYLKGLIGDGIAINFGYPSLREMLAAAAFNLKKMMRRLEYFIVFLIRTRYFLKEIPTLEILLSEITF